MSPRRPRAQRSRVTAAAARLSAMGLLFLSACGPPEADPGTEADTRIAPASAVPGLPGQIIGDVLIDGLKRPRTDEDGLIRQAVGPGGRHVIYLNFEGVKLTPNYDDSVRNQSSVIAGSVGRTVTVPAFGAGDVSSNNRDKAITDITARVRQMFSAYNVDVVIARPAQPDYVMVAVGGLPSLINQPCQGGGCVLGVAPLDCQRTANGITYNDQGDVEVVFAFSQVAAYFRMPYANAVETVAVTIAQETAHAYGLGHSANPRDIMYPSSNPQVTGFVDANSGYADGQNCARGQGTQNSHKLLLAILGAAAQDQKAPTVTITAPKAGATVGRSFTATVQPADNVGVSNVDLELTGPAEDSTSLGSAPWSWPVMVGADGQYTLKATAYDAAGNAGTASVTFTVKNGSTGSGGALGAACGSGSACAGGLCVGGICTQMCGDCPAGWRCGGAGVCERDGSVVTPEPGTVGASCMEPGDCNSGVCASSATRAFCTDACDPNDAASCPPNMYCGVVGDENYCLFRASYVTNTKGCSTGGPPGGGGGGALGLLLGLSLIARRHLRGRSAKRKDA